mgnify:CR=1 FL=1
MKIRNIGSIFELSRDKVTAAETTVDSAFGIRSIIVPRSSHSFENLANRFVRF